MSTNGALLLRRVRTPIAWLAIAGACCAFAYALWFQVPPAVDARAYDSIGWSLATGNGYVETTSPVPDAAIGRLGPGYEFFLAFWYSIVGHHVWVIWLIQSLLHAGSGIIVYQLVRQLCRLSPSVEPWALGAAAAYLFFIDLLEFPAMLLTETLFLFLMLLTVYWVVWLLQSPHEKSSHAVLLGALFALTTLVRMSVLPMVMVVVLLFAFRRAWKTVAIASAMCGILLIPWTVRNWVTYHRAIVTCDILGYDLWVGNHPAAPYPGEMVAAPEIDSYLSRFGLFATNDYGIRQVRSYLFHQPVVLLARQILKTTIYLSAARPAVFWFHLHGLAKAVSAVWSSAWAFVVLALGIGSMGVIMRFGDRIQRSVVLLALTMPLGVVWIIVETRYRYPFYPFCIIAAAVAGATMWRQGRALIVAALCGAVLIATITGYDAGRNWDRILSRTHQITDSQ